MLPVDSSSTHAIVEHSTRTTDTQDLHFIATACLMAPQGYGDLDRWLQTTKENAEQRPDWTWMPIYVGLANYRAGRFDDALEALQSREDSYIAWPLLAMTCQRLGAQADAQAWFDKAHAWYVQKVQTVVADDSTIFMNGLYHWDRACFHLLYREARSLGLGAAGPDPWNHLVQARGYKVIGEVERSEAELIAAATASRDDPDLWLVRARLFEQWDDFERAADDWQRAVDVAGDDPMPWIQRGRWYAERSEHEKADADFARAASLTPDELNRFLEAGWWVVGPFAANLDEFCPPQIDHDPFQPVTVIDPKSGLPEESVRWRNFTGGTLEELKNGTDASVYALTYVFTFRSRWMIPLGFRIRKPIPLNGHWMGGVKSV